jgi:DNA (cytosine-5)-methyltransferase 1
MSRLRSTLTVTDQFCGAGGSSIGAVAAGAELRLAMNHWDLAIETHNSNFPGADHVCADIHSVDPRRYPATDILITSPECTTHSQANTKKMTPTLFDPMPSAAQERSRATMWDVPRFAEHHRYQVVIAENVFEAMSWAPFQAWLAAMGSLGYEHRTLCLNSMIAHPTPQSRDRIYVVFWQRGNRAPDLDFRPRCYCPGCEADVEGVQSFKRADRPFGKYRQQYVYLCQSCLGQVAPYVYPADSAIDWSLPTQRIGDHKRPLAEGTRRRVEMGVEMFWRPFVMKTSFPGRNGRAGRGLEEPLPTQTGIQDIALVQPEFEPFLIHTKHTGRVERNPFPCSGPMPTQTTQNDQGLVVPFGRALSGRGLVVPCGGTLNRDARPTSEALRTLTTRQALGLALPPFYVKNYGDGTDRSMVHSMIDPLGAVTTIDHHAVVESMGQRDPFDIDDCGYRMLEPHEIGAGMAFPADYKVVGNKEQRIMQYGNAVTPPMMHMILGRCVESLDSGVRRAA